MAKFAAKQWIIVGTVACATMLQLIDSSIVNVSLSQMMGNLGATLGDISWVVTSYAVANVVMIALSGWLAQRFGRKKYFVTSIVVFTLASLACGMSTNVWALVFFRFLQGMGGGGIMATGQAILVETFPREELPFANAIYGMTVVIGPTIGPTLGGWITDHLSWNWIFYVNLPVGILATLLAWSFLPPPRHESKASTMDWAGIGLLVAGIGSLQVVLERGQEEGWTESLQIVLLMLVAAGGILGFLWHEWHTRWPVVNLRLLKSRAYATGVFFSFILGFGLYSSMFLVPIFAQGLLGFSATDTGLLMLPGSVATALGMPIIGKAMQRGVSPRLLAGSGFLLFFAFTLMLGRFDDQIGAGAFFWPLIIRGMGMGMIFIPLTTLAIADLKGAEIPQGTAMTNMVRQLGGSMGIALMTTFVSTRVTFHKAVLSDKVSEFSPEGLARLKSTMGLFLSHGDSPWIARTKAIVFLGRSVARQAALLSYLDAFRLVGIFFLVFLPLLLLFKTPAKGAKIEGVHAE